MKVLPLSVENLSGQIFETSAVLQTSWSQTIGDTTNGISGVHIFDSSVRLYGSAQELFSLISSVSVDRFTDFVFTLNTSTDAQYVWLCLYEELPSHFGISMDQCHGVNLLQGIFEAVVESASFGDLLNGKKTEINFIGFVQESPSTNGNTLISSIMFIQRENTAIYDENGCKDPNAVTFGSGFDTLCICKDGFVASTGGKTQGELDICVHCIDSEFCSFDSESCSNNDNCIASKCDDNHCEVKVS
jgi:hypothetical protein